ncbi:hypothetical protein NLG97_g11341 [Lecanicillium saksenae]|uniref:Uncharacterized protein n=1 Tax=Lecanicillium saksenae TaxID=468837 RepID=A0ACC1QCB7_9HYPO|nr:hypothetical protein NLG97_g11341 [Lecanicillium saksenae]
MGRHTLRRVQGGQLQRAAQGRRRVLPLNKYIRDWHKRPHEIQELCDKGIAPIVHDFDTGKEDIDMPHLMGQVAASITKVQPAGEIVDEMVAEATEMLHKASTPAKTNGADKTSKKTKKSKKPAPEEEEEEEEDDFEGFEEDENEDEEVEDVEKQDQENEDEEMNGADLPTDNAPILPMAADAQSFDELKLSEKTMTAIKEMGFTTMTSIQKSVRPSERFEYIFPAQLLTPRRLSLPSWPARTCSVPPRPVQARRWRS